MGGPRDMRCGLGRQWRREGGIQEFDVQGGAWSRRGKEWGRGFKEEEGQGQVAGIKKKERLKT